MKNLLVAIDQNKDAEQLINQAVQIAKLTGAKIWIIHVTEADPDDFLAKEAGPQYKYDKRAEGRREEAVTIKKWAQEIENKHNLDAEGLLIEGSVGKSIRKIVGECNIDLVVAGHRKKNLVYGLFTSNKKKDLIDDLKIPLLAVPLG
jgi:nucleotide-binding universal stress UspA family protein